MKRLIALLLIVLAVLGLFAGCMYVDSDKESVYVPYVADETESLLAPLTDNAPEEGNVSENGPPSDEAEETTVPEETTTTAEPTTTTTEATTTMTVASSIAKDGSYTSKEDVALYLYTYGHLPENFITKSQARKLGWSGGSVEKYAPGKCIGGSSYGNYEGLLPSAKGRSYYECDIDTLGAKSRGAKRIVYSNDGLIYYTDNHYESFTLLYGEE